MLVAYLMVLVVLSTGLTGLPARADQDTWRQLPPSVQTAIEREVPPWTAVDVVPTPDGTAYVVSWTEGQRRIEIRLDAAGRLAAPDPRRHESDEPDVARQAPRR